MLILTRKAGESLHIGHDVKVTVVDIKGNQVRVGIAAPADLKIYREEIYRQILEENQQAATVDPHDTLGPSDIASFAASLPVGEPKLGSSPLVKSKISSDRKN